MVNSNWDYTSVKVERSECPNDCCRAMRTMESFGMQTESSSSANVNPTICCQGMGITCEGSSVTEISWPSKGLSGKIPESFKEMTNLKKLNLSDNALSGSFPVFLVESSITDL